MNRPLASLLSSLAFVFFGVACSTSNVPVTMSPAPAHPANTGLSLTQNKQTASSGNSASTSAAASTIYFEKLHGDQITGYAFLSARASTTHPFGFDLLTGEIPFVGSAVFAPTVKGLLYPFAFTQIETFDTTPVNISASQPLSLAASTDGNWIAWVQRDGSAYLYSSQSGGSQNLNLENSKAISVRISSTAGEVLVATSAGETVLFNLDAHPTPQNRLQGIEASVSPSGDKIAIVSPSGLSVYDRSNHLIKSFEKSAMAYEPSWENETALAYWVRTDSGAELRSIDLQVGSPVKVADLHLSATTGTGIVCPHWHGSDLYFADQENGNFVIERSHAGNIADFAVPDTEGTGFVCPNIGPDGGTS